MHSSWPYPVHFGDDTKIPVPPNGDIINELLLRIVWPSKDPVNTSVATAMIDFIEIQYKEDVIERIYGENIFIQNDLTVPDGKRKGLQALVGIDTTTPLTEYYLHLPFTIKFPICALDEPPTLRVVFNKSNKFMSVPYNGILDLELITDYIFLSEIERDYFMTQPLEYLTTSYQRLQFIIDPSETEINIVTSFVNDVKELFWIIQDSDATDMYKYNYDLKDLTLSFNGVEFLSKNVANGTYLSITQPLEYHTRTPKSNIYVYSFALNPEHPQPSGEVNMSYVFNQNHRINLLPSAKMRYLRLYAHSYNVATIENGQVTMLHTTNEHGFKN